MLNRIQEINAIRKAKEDIERKEYEALKPTLVDLSLLPVIHKIFNDMLSELPLPPLATSPAQRRKLLFVILYLYAPAALIGDRIPHWVRKAIAEVLPNVSPAAISHNTDGLLFLFNNYKDFRDDVTAILKKVAESL
jgi:hypothetical protein